jgi:hypothetical protein
MESSSSIKYRGYVITPTTRLRGKPPVWTLEVQLKPAGRTTGTRRCRGANTYASQERAIDRCLEFGRQIIDGRIHARPAT